MSESAKSWCQELQGDCVCATCTPKVQPECSHCKLSLESCDKCEARLDRIAYVFRYEWVTPAHELGKYGDEVFLALPVRLAKATSNASALVLSYIHWKLRAVEEQDENGWRWYQCTAAEISHHTALSKRTVQNTLYALKEDELIKVKDDGTMHYRGRFYTINYEKVLPLGKKGRTKLVRPTRKKSKTKRKKRITKTQIK